jgi:hypothetical protein
LTYRRRQLTQQWLLKYLSSRTRSHRLGHKEPSARAQGAIGSVVGGALPGAGAASSGVAGFGQAVARAAVGNIITQGVSTAVGLQKSFSWRGVAASAVSAGVGYAVGEIVGRIQHGSEWSAVASQSFAKQLGNGNAASAISRSLISGIAAGAASSAVYGKGRVDWTSVVTDAVGATIGEVIKSGAMTINPEEAELRARFGRTAKYLRNNAEFDPTAGANTFVAGYFDKDESRPRMLASNTYVDRMIDIGESGGGSSNEASRASELQGSVGRFWSALKSGDFNVASQLRNYLGENYPTLAKGIDSITENLPELIDGAKEELKVIAPGLAIDLAMAVGGILLGKFTAGTSYALTATRVAKISAEVAGLAVQYNATVNDAFAAVDKVKTMSFSDIPEKLKGDLADQVKDTLKKHGASSIEDAIAKGLGHVLPGIEDSGVQAVMKKALHLAERGVSLITDKFTKNATPLAQAILGTAFKHYDVAEFLVGKMLEFSGLFSKEIVRSTGLPAMGPIQNKSGHGIDWMGRALTGTFAGNFIGVEVKAGLNRNAGWLSDGQLKVNDFLSSRLNSAANPPNKGHWKLANIDGGQDTVDFAKHVLLANGNKKLEGMVIQLNQMSKPTRDTVFKRW